MNWEEFDEVRDSRRSILLDTLYESIIFAVGKGFPWVEVAKVVKFTEELLKETKGMGHPEQGSARLAGECRAQDPPAVHSLRNPVRSWKSLSFFLWHLASSHAHKQTSCLGFLEIEAN